MAVLARGSASVGRRSVDKSSYENRNTCNVRFVCQGGKTANTFFWVGCAGAFDDRYKKVAGAFTKILRI